MGVSDVFFEVLALVVGGAFVFLRVVFFIIWSFFLSFFTGCL